MTIRKCADESDKADLRPKTKNHRAGICHSSDWMGWQTSTENGFGMLVRSSVSMKTGIPSSGICFFVVVNPRFYAFDLKWPIPRRRHG